MVDNMQTYYQVSTKLGFHNMPSLSERISNVSAFLKQENFAGHPLKYEGDTAVLVIDVQNKYCNPKGFRGNKETDDVSKRIQLMVPEFRSAGVPVYVIYYSKEGKGASEINFYKFKPTSDDVLIAKKGDSAFKSSKIKKVLKKDRRKSLLVCGFNLNACVKNTVIDARENGFNVSLLRDLTGNDNECCPNRTISHLIEMQDEGVVIEQSSKALKRINTQKNAAAVPAI